MTNISIWFPALASVLLIVSIIRLATTPRHAPVRQERSDTCVLLLLVLMGAAGSLIRDKFPLGTGLYWAANAVLVPIGLLAVWFIIRLIRIFRGDAPRTEVRNTTVIRPPDTKRRNDL